MPTPHRIDLSCPAPRTDRATITMAHGGGGRLMHQLLEQTFLPAFRNPLLEQRHDGANLEIGGARLAFTTDSYVVHPLFFPGGDLGSLAVYGTVNDLAMCGARPLYLSAGFILEEGLPLETLRRIVASMRHAAEHVHAQFACGDTKVVEHGKGDGIFVTTAGIGSREHGLTICPHAVRPGDALILNGDLGRHGIALMAAREGLELETTLASDCAPLVDPVFQLLDAGLDVHCLRDLTRGGLASCLVEIAESSALGIAVDERAIPVRDEVRGVCEILGLDALHVACEGRFVAFVPEAQADRALALLGGGACRIGQVDASPERLVTLRSQIGTTRILDMLSGEQLPRIC